MGSRDNTQSQKTPQQNGVVERKNRTVQQMARSMMNEKNIGQTYQVEAILFMDKFVSADTDQSP